MLPQTNATLTAVTGPGSAEDYDRPATDGPVKWAGSERVYLLEQTSREDGQSATTVVETRTLIVSDALGVAWSEGDTVTVARVGEPPVTVPVRAVAPRRVPGLPGTVALTLEDR